MASCGTCMNRYSIDGTNELRCSVHMVSISSYSWCGQHDPQPSETEVSKVELAAYPLSRRITDNPRSAENIHD